MLYYKGLYAVKDDVIGVLKTCFAFDKDFEYRVHNEEQSILKIYDGFPRETRHMPAIIITESTCSPKPVGIGREEREDTYIGGIPAMEHGGMLDITLTLDCIAETSTDREMLADRTMMYLWWVGREYLYEGGVVVTKADISGESEIDYGSDKIMVSKINFACWTEWSEIIAEDILQGIRLRLGEIRDVRKEYGLPTTEAIKKWYEDLLP